MERPEEKRQRERKKKRDQWFILTGKGARGEGWTEEIAIKAGMFLGATERNRRNERKKGNSDHARARRGGTVRKV